MTTTVASGKPTTMHRAAAALALVALAAALLFLAVAAIHRLDILLVSVISLGVAVVGAWYVVSRRGAARAAAAALAVVALVGFVVVMVSSQSVRVLVVGLGLAAVSVAAAGYALTSGASAGDTERAPRARHPVLLMNPRSGGGKVERFGLVDLCRQRGIEPYVLRPGDDLRQVAEDAVARGADLLGMAGGDGSLAIVATVVSGHGIPFVVVPAGTRNHFALDLGLDRADVPGALDAYDDGVDTRVDLAEINGRVFVNNASMGVYAKVVQSADYRDAKVSTAAAMLPDLLGPGAKPLDLHYNLPSGRRRPQASCCWCPTTPTTWRTCVAGAPASASTAACLASSRCESMEQPTLRSLPRWRPRARSGASPAGRSGRRPSSWSDRPGRWRSASTGRPWSSSHRSASPSGRAL